jgi:hypothetical protein
MVRILTDVMIWVIGAVRIASTTEIAGEVGVG